MRPWRPAGGLVRAKTPGPIDRVAGRRTIPSPTLESPMRHLPLVVCLGLAGLLACTGSGPGPVDTTPSQSTGECKLEWRAPDPQPSAGVAPFSLTTQDGSGLQLLSVK